MKVYVALAVMLGFAAAQAQQRTQSIHSCMRLQQADTRYVLSQDVAADGTCFSIEADNVTLDLGGHTVTYANSANVPSFGVLAADCWYQPIAGNPCGGTHRNADVMHGSIVQGTGAQPASHAIRFGQAAALTGIRVHDLAIEVHAEDSIAIYSEHLPGGSEIYANKIRNNVRTISSRMQFRGMSIKLDDEQKATLPDNIHDNVIVGGAQAGIRSDNPAGTTIAHNDIAQDAVYANGFCIDAAGNNMHVVGNHCHPVHGRGIHANHSGVEIRDNTVETVDGNQIAEYHGCEANGTYGIQIEDDGFAPQDIRVTGNHVRVTARECSAEAMRVTDLKRARVEIHDNEFAAVQEHSQQGARAISFGDVDGANMSITGNVLRADSAMVHVDWDAADNIVLLGNTFKPVSRSTLLAEIISGSRPTHGMYFENANLGGLSPRAVRFGPEAKDSWYALAEKYSPSISGPKAGGEVKAVLSTGNISYEASVHEGGVKFIVPTEQFQNGKPPVLLGHYKLRVEAAGCEAYESTFASAAGAPRSIALTCR